MDAEMNDSFSVSSDSLLIERKYLRTTLLWNIVCLRDRGKYSPQFLSPAFQCANNVWQVVACFYLGYHESYMNLRCLDPSQSSTYSIYLGFKIVEDGNILHECSGQKFTYCRPFSPREIMRKKILLTSTSTSLTISFELCLEDNAIPVFPHKVAAKRVQDEKKDTSPDCTLRSLSCDFEELYENGQLSDVTLKLGEKEFWVHKAVLSARSKVFAAMFEHDMKENVLSTVDLVQMEAETVEDMLRYMYCGRVSELSASDALHLYVAADHYDVNGLRSICREVIVMGMSINNVCDIAAVADFHKDELLITELKFFLSKNGKDLIKTENWKAVCIKSPVLGTKMFELAFSE